MKIHSEIKALTANLIRNEFTRYSNSEEFKLVLLENDFDDHLNSFLIPTRMLDPKQKLNAFATIIGKSKSMDLQSEKYQRQLIYHKIKESRLMDS